MAKCNSCGKSMKKSSKDGTCTKCKKVWEKINKKLKKQLLG